MPDIDIPQAAGVAQDTAGVKVPIKLLDQKHPWHTAKAEAWKQIGLLYEDGTTLAANASQLLMAKPKEPNEVYTARVQRLCSFANMSTGIDWYKGKMFRDEPQIGLKMASGEVDEKS